MLPDGPIEARLVVLHGYGEHAARHAPFMQWIADRGVACFAVDFRGHGRSAGKPGAILRWDEFLDDLQAFLALPELAPGLTPLFLLGHSHGGLVAVAAAMRGLLNHCQGIVLISPYLQLKLPVPILKRFIGNIASFIHPTLAIKSGVNGPMLSRDTQLIEETKNDPWVRGIATPRWFTQTMRVQAQVRSTPDKFKLPLLMLLPGADTVADANASVAFFNHCSAIDKTIHHYPEHRHELLRELGREKIFETILDWIQARLASA